MQIDYLFKLEMNENKKVMKKIFKKLDQISFLCFWITGDYYICLCIAGALTKKKSTQKNQLKVELLEEAGYLNEIILDCVPDKIFELAVDGNYDIVNFTKVKEKMKEISVLRV